MCTGSSKGTDVTKPSWYFITQSASASSGPLPMKYQQTSSLTEMDVHLLTLLEEDFYMTSEVGKNKFSSQGAQVIFF